MTYAYDEKYLDDAMKNLGEAFDYAVNFCKLSIDDFWNLFIVSGYADNFGKGNPRIISGLSGTELVLETLHKAGLNIDIPESRTDYECSPEYWIGWIIAYYQWRTCRSFKDIHNNISGTEMLKLYPTMHEVSEEKFIDTLNSIIKRKKASSKIQQQRKICGYSQRELSEKSGVNIRTLQQYELKTKDINKASVQTIIALSNILGCRIEDILE